MSGYLATQLGAFHCTACAEWETEPIGSVLLPRLVVLTTPAVCAASDWTDCLFRSLERSGAPGSCPLPLARDQATELPDGQSME